MPYDTTLPDPNLGHIHMVESDTDYGRHWATFDCTGPDAAQQSADLQAYLTRLGEDGTLSDYDCSGACPCVQPVDGCEQCEAVGFICLECRNDQRDAEEQMIRNREHSNQI